MFHIFEIMRRPVHYLDSLDLFDLLVGIKVIMESNGNVTIRFMYPFFIHKFFMEHFDENICFLVNGLQANPRHS